MHRHNLGMIAYNPQLVESQEIVLKYYGEELCAGSD